VPLVYVNQRRAIIAIEKAPQANAPSTTRLLRGGSREEVRRAELGFENGSWMAGGFRDP